MNASYRSIILAVSVSLALSASISAAPGDLDPTFGIGGRLYPPSGAQIQYAVVNDVVVQSDQKILVSDGSLLSRYLPNGTLDPTFGVGGQVFLVGGGGWGTLALQSDGKILVAAGNIFRYKTDGNLDTAFDGDGVLSFKGGFEPHRLAVQNDGKIIVAGTRYIPFSGNRNLFGLARLNSDGSFDTAFGTNGIVTTEFLESSDLSNMVIQADGKIVAAGGTCNGSNASNCTIALSRYNVDGSLDTSFGTSGLVVTPNVRKDNWVGVSDVTLQADNKIVVAARYNASGLVLRYMPDGSLDPSFGDAGQVSIPNLCPSGVAVQSNGMIVLAGDTNAYSPSSSSHELGRLLPNGVLDPTFGNNGRVTTVFPNLPQSVNYIEGRVYGMALQGDGKIVTAGYWSGTDGDGNGVWGYGTIARYIGDQTPTLTCPNPIDCADFFVRQHYRDFLNREPDAAGLAFWTNEINACGFDAQCAEVKRINVSAAYFLSIEFQESGYLVYRFYKSAFGNLPDAPVPVRLSDFLPDAQAIGQGVIVNQGNWQQQLETNKQNYANAFVQRAAFTSSYPPSMTPGTFVDTLFANAGLIPSSSDRAAAVAEFGSASNTTDTAARARALRLIAENSTLQQQEFNRAFVLMQYFGYLRRNPNDPPEPTLDFQGYNFWLNKLNQFNGDFVQAEMVKAFLVSTEYRQRFGQP
jgi:uncharacterized delta-60 repeat protein